MIQDVLRLLVAFAAASAPASDITKDRASVLASDALSGVMVDYCRQAAPNRMDAITSAWQKWRTASQIDAIRTALGSQAVAGIDAGSAKQAADIRQKMASAGTADTVCSQLPAMWAQPGFDMRASYPAAYPVGPTPQAAPAQTPVDRPATAGPALSQSQIETIVSSFYEGYQGLQFTVIETAYLVLKDGTVRHGLPDVGPSGFDIAADRAKFPKRWGRWQKSGGAYTFQFPGDNSFTSPRGAQVRGPARAGLTLDNRYQSASGYQIAGGAGSFSFHNLILRSDGRFTRSNTGFVGGTIGTGNTTVAAGTNWDDKGSATTVTGQGAAGRGGSVSHNGTTDADLQGSYRITGYELELKFDSGRRESHFFFVSADQKLIGLDDGTMIVRKP